MTSPRLHDLIAAPRTRTAVTLALVVVLATWMGASAGQAEHPVLAAGISLAALSTMALLRSAPIVALAASFAAAALMPSVGGYEGPDDGFLVLILASSYAVGRYGRYRDQPYVGAGVLALTSMNFAAPGPVSFPQQLVFPLLIVAAPWAAGLLIRRAGERESEALVLAEELELAHDTDLEEARLQERLRIARELHDVTAHTLSVVSLQAQVLRRKTEKDQPISLDDAVALESSAHQAMSELRRLVELMRPSGDDRDLMPEPSLDQLPALLDECRRAGQAVECTVEGEPRSISAGLSLSAYRILQESMTNARRHGSGDALRLSIGWTQEALTLTAVNPCSPADRAEGTRGMGLVGIHERARLFHGEVEAGPLEHGTWVVRARLPISQHA